MSDLLPCPLCGASKGYELAKGDTSRWWLAVCAGCGDFVCECRSDSAAGYNAELPTHWGPADLEWNRAAKHAHELRLGLDSANAEIERLRAENDRLTTQITAFKDGWMRVIDTEMVITHMGIAEFDDDYLVAKTKLLRLIDWYVSMRTDPAMNGGRQLVPVEPTPEMLYAAFAADKEYSARMFGSMSAVVSVGAYDHYVAMLAAAPKPEDV